MNQHLPGFVLAAALATIPAAAHAQSAAAQPAQATAPARDRAFVVNAGPMIGVLGGGVFVRVNPEFQIHRDRRFERHMLGIGLAVTFWPNEAGPSFALAARYQYDHPLVAGTPFFVSPYAGLDVGMGVFDVFNDASQPRFIFVLMPNAGIDLKVVLNRLVLGFRPLGVTVPLFFGGPRVTGDVIYDIALTLGFTY